MHSKGLWRPDSEEFSAHPEPSRTPAAHARGRPASSRLLCELLDRILAGVHYGRDKAKASRIALAKISAECRPGPLEIGFRESQGRRVALSKARPRSGIGLGLPKGRGA